jgi:hypothetical protein
MLLLDASYCGSLVCAKWGMTISCRVREDMNSVGYQVNSAGFAGRRGPFFIFT